jgi:hypothetical protein
MSSEEFFRFCGANPDWRIEQTADGEIIIVPPAGGESSYSSLEASAPRLAHPTGRQNGLYLPPNCESRATREHK